MIGGADIVVAEVTRREDARFVFAILRQRWPEAVYHDGESTTARPIADLPPPVPVEGHLELFVYDRLLTFESWMNDGATDENADAMVHIIFEPGQLTFVVGASPSALAAIVDEIRTRLVERHDLQDRAEAADLGVAVDVGADAAAFAGLEDIALDAAKSGAVHTLPRHAAAA